MRSYHRIRSVENRREGQKSLDKDRKGHFGKLWGWPIFSSRRPTANNVHDEVRIEIFHLFTYTCICDLGVKLKTSNNLLNINS